MVDLEKLVQFVKKYNGKKIDYDRQHGAQCVDLFRQCNVEVHGIEEHTGSCTSSGGAKDLYLDYPVMPVEKKYFLRLSDKATPVPGDAAIWGESGKNLFGHVAIVLGVLGDDLIVFEQDGFKLDGAKITVRSTNNLLGFLRKK